MTLHLVGKNGNRIPPVTNQIAPITAWRISVYSALPKGANMEIAVQGLLAALSDPEKVVRIASLRALVRLPLGSDTADKIRPLRAEYERRDISWATWVPDEETAGQIAKLVALPAGEERRRARRIAASAKSPITRRFARLALDEYDPKENLLVAAESVATDAYKMGSELEPDIRGLFAVYGVFLRRAAGFWFDWVRNFPDYDPSRELPSWFSSDEGALAVSRQIEWTVSRTELPVVLAALNHALKRGSSRQRFAAAQLIEWARRTASVKEPWSFAGGAGAGDVFAFDTAPQLIYKSFAAEDLPVASAWGPALRPPRPPETGERKINFWIKEAENTDLKLESGTAYTGNVRVGKPVASSLIRGPDSTIPDSDVPPGGLRTDWTILPTDVHLEALGPAVSVSKTGLVTFSLLVPETGESETVQFRLTPQSAKAQLRILIFIGGKLYRELEVSLESEAHIVKDDALTRAAETDLQTGNEWTTPPGVLTMRVWKTAKAVISGCSGDECFPEGQEISIGTAKAELSKVVDNLRTAAENFRATYTEGYLNEIDGSKLLPQLASFQPQYDWSRLSYSADPGHDAAWNKAANSQQLRDVAFYGRRLYDTLFPPQSDSRVLLEQLPPGQLIHVVWRQDSGADWVPDLPWSLLYVGDVDSGVEVDGTRFWGLRFRIAYTAYNPKGTLSVSLGKPTDASCTSLLFFGDSKNEPATEEARWQRAYWASLGSKILHCVVPSDGATIPKDELKAALKKPEALIPPPKTAVAVLYLFCHYGVDAGGTPILRFGLDASEPGDIIREPEMGTEQLASRPLVFANACATAGSSVYSTNAIIKTFFDRGCRAFIGTECMVPAVMAGRFAVIFFHFLLGLVNKGKQPMAAGEALAQTRLFLWTHYRNIGGLLYSYLNHYDLYMADQAQIKGLWKTL